MSNFHPGREVLARNMPVGVTLRTSAAWHSRGGDKLVEVLIVHQVQRTEKGSEESKRVSWTFEGGHNMWFDYDEMVWIQEAA